MKPALLLITAVLLNLPAFAQSYFIRGSVKDKNNKQVLSYTNVRVAHSTIGTAANKEGEYELKLPAGRYKLIASYIGYNSDTISVELNKNLTGQDFYLAQTNVNLPEITVTPGENPALKIISKAIAKRKERDRRLLSYEFDAYTKGVVLTQKDINVRSRNLNLGLGSDTSALKITGILENESKGYYKKPDKYKEIITARKQSANFSSSINVLTGGRVLQNFYDNKVNFFGSDLPGPLSDNALSYYYFYIKKILAINNRTVYDIYMTPDDPGNPGFYGDIFITGGYDLIKVELQLNRAANTGGLFDTISVFQQYSSFADSIFMPVDYRLYLKLNYLNLAKLGFELNTVLYDYKINPFISSGFFNKAILTVLPDADKKDSTYWQNAVTIPNTSDEQAAYKRIDSLSTVPRNFWKDFNLFSTRINFSDNFSVSAPLGMYHFNRVEGNSLDFGFFLSRALDYRWNSSLNFTYGFSDKKLKTNLNASYLWGSYRTYRLSLHAFNKINVLFGNSDYYNDLTSTLLALLSKEDFRDYYYSKGISIEASGEVFPVLRLNIGFNNHTDNNAYRNTEFSFFAKDKTFRLNPPIYETRVNDIRAGFEFDFRDYIEDGLFRRRTSMGKSYATFGGEVIYSDKNALKSGLDFTIYEFNSSGVIRTFNSASLNFKLFAMYTNGSLPYQMYFSLPGNIDWTAQRNSFRTLNLNEVLGNRVVTLNLEHYFGDELFRLLKIPGVRNWDLQFYTFLNAAYSDVNSGSRTILPYRTEAFTHPFYEIGFGIGQALIPLQLEFAWKLNYRGRNNFRIGLNSFIF